MSIPRPERETILEALRQGLWRFFADKHVAPCIPVEKMNFQLEHHNGCETLKIMGVSQAGVDEPEGRKPGINVLVLASSIDFPDVDLDTNKIQPDFDGSCHHAVLLRRPMVHEKEIPNNNLVVEPLVVTKADGLDMFVSRYEPLVAVAFTPLA